MSASVAYLPDPQALASCLLVHMQTIEALDSANLAEGADLMVDLGALGLARGIDPGSVTADLAILCAAAEEVGMTVTLDGAAHEHLDDVLSIHAALAGDHPDLGVTIAANLLRSEADCGDLARAGARVRLVRTGVGRGRRGCRSPTGTRWTRPTCAAPSCSWPSAPGRSSPPMTRG